MVESQVLRKRNATSPSPSPSSTGDTKAPSVRHAAAVNSNSFQMRNRLSNILFIQGRVAMTTLLLALFIVITYFTSLTSSRDYAASSGDDIILLDPIEILSNVPLGFALSIPNLLPSTSSTNNKDRNEAAALDIYIDSRYVSSIVSSSSKNNKIPTMLLPSSIINNYTSIDHIEYNFGTCDIKDRGNDGQLINHTFSLGQEILDIRKMKYLKPGTHIVQAYQKSHRTKKWSSSSSVGNNVPLMVAAQLAVTVHSPPQLLLGYHDQASASSPYEEAYTLAIHEIGTNIACEHFVAGSGWVQLWTRDTSYASELGLSILHPQVVKQSLMSSVEVWKSKTKKKKTSSGRQQQQMQEEEEQLVWLQDTCSHFGGWPILSDAIVGTRGAWSLYLVTGDVEFLRWAYQVTLASLDRAEEESLDKDTGLFLGCSSFLESNSGYPEKYASENGGGNLVGKTKALSTNMLYYSGYKYASKMGKELGYDSNDIIIITLEEKAKLLKKTIQERLWSSTLQNYAYFEDEYGLLVEHTEGLGSALALLEFDDHDDNTTVERNNMIFESTYTTKEYGIPCLWPQFQYSANVWEWRVARHYHNGRLWPFVQGYWAMAAAHHRREDVFTNALRGITALSQIGNTFAEYYNLNGTYVDGRRSQLWSAAGYISMIYHGIFGIRLNVDGIHFSHPMKTKELFSSSATTIELKELRYRRMILNIRLHGFGKSIVSFKVNQIERNDMLIKSSETGVIDVDITLE